MRFLDFGNCQRKIGLWTSLIRKLISYLLLAHFSLSGFQVAAQVPKITSFSPTSATVGTNILINGINFNATPANNIVYFGTTRATVLAGGAVMLTVTVPAGAAFGPITVLNSANGLSTASVTNFIPLFGPNSGQITNNDFDPAVDFPAATGVYGSNITDLDNDGKPDVIVVNSETNSFSVFPSTAQPGNIALNSLGSRIDFPTGNNANALAVGDINGDGLPDIAIVNYGESTVSVFKNTSSPGNINFQPRVDFATGNNPVSVAIKDLNADGKPDIAVSNSNSNTVSVFQNASTIASINFAAKVDFATQNYPNSVCLSDMDGDGKPELVVANYGSNSVSILRNNITSGNIISSSFAAAVNIAAGDHPNMAIAGDMNEDGMLDIEVANSFSDNVSILINVSSLNFLAAINFSVGSGPSALVMSDMDGDGKPDLVISNQSSSTVSILRNKFINPGAFLSSSLAGNVEFNTGSLPHFLSVGDIDGDGKPDILTTNFFFDNSISIVHNNPVIQLAPKVAGFTPMAGSVGTTVTITGEHFGDNIADNLVFFGTIKASILSASSTDLVVTVPAGAVNNQLLVVNTSTHLSGNSNNYFITTFLSPDPAVIKKSDLVLKATINTETPHAVSLETGDLDGDGKEDVAVSMLADVNNSQAISIYRNISSPGAITNNSFADRVDFPAVVSNYLRIVDLNNDGKPEIVTGGAIMLNTAVPGIIDNNSFAFVSSPLMNPNSETYSKEIVDIDKDGKKDIITLVYYYNNTGHRKIKIYRNTSVPGGDISFADPIEFFVSDNASSMTLNDLDGDDKPEIILYDETAKTVIVYRNISLQGNITANSFANPIGFAGSNYSGGEPVITGDIDGDGKLDVITSNRIGNLWHSVFRNISNNIGTIDFAAKVDFALGGSGGIPVMLADLNGDSKLDLVTSSSAFQNTSVPGTTTMNSPVFFLNTVSAPSKVADVDLDGKPDLVSVGVSAFFVLANDPKKLSTQVSGTSFCAGAGFSINFTLDGTYPLDPNNVYTAQLSDSSGKFISPVTIGTTTGTTNGGMSVVIPMNTIPAVKYRIRVISSSPAIAGYDNGSDITINPTPVASINPTQGNLCNGATTLYASSNSSIPLTYLWSNNATDSAVTVTQAGTYSYACTNAYGCTGSATAQVVNYSNCGGYLEAISDPIVNYFDTIHVTVYIKGGVNVFSTFAYLNFDNSIMRLVDAQVGDYLGSNILNSPPVVTNGQIDFGMSKLAGALGSNGNGVIYKFKFLLTNLPSNVPFYLLYPNSFTTLFNLSNITCYNTSGIESPSFDAISVVNASTICRYYVPVWPGDLNNDKTVNVSDILPIGYFYGKTGPVRPNGSLLWVAQPAPLWAFDKTYNYSPAWRTFADGNADGVINLADQSAIGFNLGQVHARFGDTVVNSSLSGIITGTTDLPALNVQIPDISVNSGSLPLTEQVDITIGSAANPVNNLYGVAFDLLFDPAYVNTSTLSTNYNGSIFGVLGTNFTRIEDNTSINNGRLSIGMTRFNTTSVTGNGGKLLTVNIPLLATPPPGYLVVRAVPLSCNDQTGVPISIDAGKDSVQVLYPGSIITQNNFTSHCQGSLVTVPFTVTGTYNPGNVFTAQLSNSTGSFLSATTIGTLAGTSAGNISATIPANTASGAGYRIRVVSSNPVVIGADNGSDIHIGSTSTYSFIGSGNWSNPSNWSNSIIPPAILPSCEEIVINPSGNTECILDITQTISAGAKLTVVTGKKFRIPGNLNIQ